MAKKSEQPGVAESLTVIGLKALTAANAGQRVRDPGNLVGHVRITRTGEIRVGFEYRYRAGARTRSIGVGIWPDATLAAIRKQRDTYKVMVDAGGDPLETQRIDNLARKAEDAESAASAQARLDAVAGLQTRMTVRNLFDRWERLALAARKDKGAEVRRMFEKDVLPELGAMAVEDVKKRHAAAMLDKIKERGVGRMVNLMLAQVRQMFRFAVARDWIEADPTAVLKKSDFGGKEVERERTLSEAEIRELAIKLPAAKFIPSTEAAIWIMLSTCCRVGEISKARWSDLDVDARRWRIPPANAKNGREHTVALSDFAASHFEALRAIQTSSAWILPASRPNDSGEETHVDDKSISKQIRDRQRTTPMKGRSKASAAVLLAGGEWTPHDLRRTGATLMGDLGVDGDVIERCLNHIEPNRIKRTYQRQRTDVAKAEAWRLLGDRLELLTQANDTNIVTLKRKV